MVTIIGNGLGDYTFDNLEVNFCEFDKIICDTNFKENGNNILKCDFQIAKEYIVNNYNKENILYVVTGSPFFFSTGVSIAKELPYDQVKIINNTSSKFYIQEKLFISDQEIDTFSLKDNEDIDLTKFLKNTYTFILCDRFTIPKIQDQIKLLKPQDIEATIGYKLGYDDEIIEQINLFNLSYRAFDMDYPYVLVIKRLFSPKSEVNNIENI